MSKYITILILIVFLVFQISGADTEIKNGSLIKINGVNLFVKEIGQGEPVIVLHGGPGMFHDYFLPHMEKLSKGRKLIFFDQRGNGRSLIEINSENYNIEKLIGDIEGLREHYKLEKINLIGHSFGGFLAMQYGIKYPCRLKSLILMNSAPASSALMMKAIMNKQSKYSQEDIAEIRKLTSEESFLKGDPEVIKKFFRVAEKNSVYDQKNLNKVFSTPFTNVTAKNLLIINQLANKIFATYNIVDQLEKIKCPTLIIHGKEDFIPLESSKGIHKSIKNSRMVVLENCAHYPFIEAPQKLFPILENFYNQK